MKSETCFFVLFLIQLFQKWKETKDVVLKEKYRETMKAQRRAERAKEEKKEEKLKDAESAFKIWYRHLCMNIKSY